jgi:hypothetical protein
MQQRSGRGTNGFLTDDATDQHSVFNQHLKAQCVSQEWCEQGLS